MDIESLRTLAKRLQVRLGVLEDILEQTGIMSEEKREELYAKHSAAYDQDEARTLSAASDRAMAEYQSGTEEKQGEELWDQIVDEIEAIPEEEGDLNTQLEIWSRCGCNNCHANIISTFAVIDATQYWQDVVEFGEEVKSNTGCTNWSIVPEMYELFVEEIGHNSVIYSSKPTVAGLFLVEDEAKIQDFSENNESYTGSLGSFGDGVFAEDDICDAGVDEVAPAKPEAPLMELLAIINQPLLLFGSTEEWINAVREAASRVQP